MGFEPLILDGDDRVLHMGGYLVKVFPNLLDALEPLPLDIFAGVRILDHDDARLMLVDLAQVGDAGGAAEIRYHVYRQDTAHDTAGDGADEDDGQQAFGYGGYDFQGHFHRRFFPPFRFLGHQSFASLL